MSKLAYVLMTCNIGKKEFVRTNLKEFHEVKELEETHGAYDIIAKIETSNQKSLSSVAQKIRKHENVRSALTLRVIDMSKSESQLVS